MPDQQPQPESTLQSLAGNLCSIVVALFVFTFLFENFMIPSASMASTILVGDHLVVARANLAPPGPLDRVLPFRELHRGDPVVFYKPIQESDGTQLTLVKRIVGVPGDRIHLRDGVLYLNGVAQHEPYAALPTPTNSDLYRDNFPAIPPDQVPNVTARWTLDLPDHVVRAADGTADLVVPPGSYFVMGDNRTNSLDGRYWGFVARANVIGRPLFNYWSFPTPDNLDRAPLSSQAAFTVHELTHFVTETRWSRTFHPIN
jgi:signal peptidase I